jgi:hypothetical protein
MMLWVLSFSVLGSIPHSGELAKYHTKEECQQALVGIRQEYQSKNKKIAASCTQRSTVDNNKK